MTGEEAPRASSTPVPEDDTVVRPRSTVASDARSAGLNVDLDDTIVRLIQPHPPAREPADLLVAAPPVSTEPLPVPDAAPTAAPARVESAVVWALSIRGTDVIVPLDRPVVIGRQPRASRIEESPAPRRVKIPAENRDVSARHARLEQLGDTLVVTDLGSTNGVDVHWSSGSVRRLRPGETSVVLPDAVVALGDAVVIEFVVSQSR